MSHNHRITLTVPHAHSMREWVVLLDEQLNEITVPEQHTWKYCFLYFVSSSHASVEAVDEDIEVHAFVISALVALTGYLQQFLLCVCVFCNLLLCSVTSCHLPSILSKTMNFSPKENEVSLFLILSFATDPGFHLEPDFNPCILRHPPISTDKPLQTSHSSYVMWNIGSIMKVFQKLQAQSSGGEKKNIFFKTMEN